MKYHSKCIDRNGKEVTLVAKGETVEEATEYLHKVYGVTEVVEILEKNTFNLFKYAADNIHKAPERSKAHTGYQKRHSRRKLYC